MAYPSMTALRPFFEVMTKDMDNDAFHEAFVTFDADVLAQDTDAAEDRYLSGTRPAYERKGFVHVQEMINENSD